MVSSARELVNGSWLRQFVWLVWSERESWILLPAHFVSRLNFSSFLILAFCSLIVLQTDDERVIVRRELQNDRVSWRPTSSRRRAVDVVLLLFASDFFLTRIPSERRFRVPLSCPSRATPWPHVLSLFPRPFASEVSKTPHATARKRTATLCPKLQLMNFYNSSYISVTGQAASRRSVRRKFRIVVDMTLGLHCAFELAEPKVVVVWDLGGLLSPH